MNKLRLILFLLLTVNFTFAQDLNNLTPEQMAMYKQYMSSKNLGDITNNNPSTISPDQNFSKRTVMGQDSLNKQQNQPKEDQYIYYKNNKYKLVQASDTINQLTIFGSSLFKNKDQINFTPKLNIPTPENYVIGTYDQIIIDISGLYEANYKLQVTPDGFINIPNVGTVKVSGLNIDDAKKLITNKFSKIYMGIDSGKTTVNISLGNIRSINVAVIGEAVHPGTYTLPSLATAFNAIYACGGPNDIGSYRSIKVIRSGKVISTLDIYKFLVEGKLPNDVVLQNGDVIKIDPYKDRVFLNGAVKHPGIFESLNNESLQDLMNYGGGYAFNANKSDITVFRIINNFKSVVDVPDSLKSKFILDQGDSCVVTSVFDKFNNRIDLVGEVYKPGAYALDSGMTVSQLIKKANGLKDDAYLDVAQIVRERKNSTPEIIGFNLGKVMDGKAPDISLQNNDSVKVFNIDDFKLNQNVSILGAVKVPGVYPLIDSMTVRDLITTAKGFKEFAATDSIELIRSIKNKKMLLNTNVKSKVFKLSFDKNLNIKNGSKDMTLESGDQVVVRKIAGYEGIRMVRVEGEVLYPGSYNILNKSEKISDVVRRAGGFTKYAYPQGAFMIRSVKLDEVEQKLNKIIEENAKKQLETQAGNPTDANSTLNGISFGVGTNAQQNFSPIDSIKNQISGSNSDKKVNSPEGVVGLNLEEIMKSNGGKYDLKLEEGDIIYVPREIQTVRVLGQVLFPTLVRYDKSMKLKDYINSSGGYALNAHKSKVFVIYPNGVAKSTKKFIGFNIYPKIVPGTKIIVPQKVTEKNKLTAAETVAMFSSISSSLVIVWTVLRSSLGL